MKIRNKLILILVLLLVSITLLLLFGELINYPMIKQKKDIQDARIVVIYKSIGTGMEFWDVVKDGMDVAAKEFGIQYKLMGPEGRTETDVEAQIAILEDVIKEKPDAIILVATDYNRLVPPVEKAKNEGIKVITMDSGLNSDISDSFIATDNIEAGRKAAKEIGRLIDENAEIAVISHVKGATTAVDREKGLMEGLREYNISKIHGPFFSEADTQKAAQIAKELLSKTHSIKGIVGLNEGSTVGAAAVVKEMNLGGKIKVVGFDSSFDEIKLIEEGVIQATVVQNPFNMGYKAIEAAIKSFKGEKISKRVDTGSIVVTKENMYTNENQRLLFPFIDK